MEDTASSKVTQLVSGRGSLMPVSPKHLGVHRAGLKSPLWVKEVLLSVLNEKGCPVAGVGHLTLKNASLQP